MPSSLLCIFEYCDGIVIIINAHVWRAYVGVIHVVRTVTNLGACLGADLPKTILLVNTDDIVAVVLVFETVQKLIPLLYEWIAPRRPPFIFLTNRSKSLVLG